jgi:hypothetical protein
VLLNLSVHGDHGDWVGSGVVGSRCGMKGDG